MGKRGRPPHPDILTPREWEVLALLRQGLSNPEIAERLGISRDGAKYHVSQILGKLGLQSRDEAARWQYEDAPPWWATAFVPFLPGWRRLSSTLGSMAGSATRLIAVAVLAAALGGLGLLALLLFMQSDDGGNAAPTATPDTADQVFTFNTQSLPLPAQPERSTLFVIGEDGQGLTELASEDTIFDVQWAPGGERLAYRSVTNRIATLSILNLEDGSIDDVVVAEDLGKAIYYLWGPSGELIVALIGDTARVIRLDGTEIASFEATALVEWSPDGQQLLVFREERPNRPEGDLYLVNPSTWVPNHLTKARRSSWQQGAWSPDSSTVSFLRQDIGPTTEDCFGMFAVDLIEVDSGVVSQPMEPVCKAIQSHSWSPDGTSIALGVVETGGEESNGIRLLGLEERSLMQITEDLDFEAVWVGNQALAVHRASCWGCDGNQSWALVTSSGDELAEWPGTFPRLDVAEASNAIALGLPSGRLELADGGGQATGSPLDQAPFMFGDLVWSADGTQIAFVSWQGLTDTTYIASLADEEWQGLVLPSDARGTKLSPDWQRVAYILDRQLIVANADGSDARMIADDLFTIREALAWSPDGTHIAFFRQPGFDRVELALVDPDGGQIRVLRDMGNTDLSGGLAWSPDSNTILLSVTSAGVGVQALLDVESGEEVALAGLAAGGVAWSPDGTEVASIAEDGVQVLDPETTEQRTVVDLMQTSELAVPAWSPDGETIAVFETDTAAQHAMVTLVAADGELLDKIRLPVPAPDPWVNMRVYSDVLHALWSPDGTQLAFNYLSEDGLRHGVFVLDIETKELREISLSSRSNYRHVILAWSPDGNQLIFQSQWYTL